MNTPARRMVSLVYTTRDYDLFQWAMSAISTLVPVCEAKGISFDVKMAYTGSMTMTEDSSHDIESTTHTSTNMVDSLSMHGHESMPMHDMMHSDRGEINASGHGLTASTHDMNVSAHSTRSILSRNKSVKTQPGRFDLYGEIENKSTVFCQGSAGLKVAVEAVCKKVGARFYGGRGGAREDLV